MSRPCVFFDRDGIVNEAPDPERYVTRFERFHILPGFLDALRVVGQAGCAAVVVTNQRGVALGLIPQAELDRMHAHLLEQASRHGGEILDVLVCPFDDDEHPWRKPQPGMLLEAARRHDLDLSLSWMVGDQEGDVLAGHRAGCRALRLLRKEEPTRAEVVIRSIADLPSALQACLGLGPSEKGP